MRRTWVIISMSVVAACGGNVYRGDGVPPSSSGGENDGERAGDAQVSSPADAGASAVDAGTIEPPPELDAGPPPSACSGEVFTPDTPIEPWRNRSTQILTVTQGAADHRCKDVIVNPDQDAALSGWFTYGPVNKDLEGEDVELWLHVACGQWIKLGRATTGPGDGSLAYTVPAGARPGAGRFAVKMLVKGDHSSADCAIYAWLRGQHAIVSDVDGTITTAENDGLNSVLDPAAPLPNPSSPEAFQSWASKGWSIIYLTARPEFLTSGTRAWLAAKGFPTGVVHLSDTTLGAMGAAATDYKAGYLQPIAANQGVVLDAAYGNQDTDLAAYLRAGLPPAEIRLYRFTGALMGATGFDDYAGEVARVSSLPPVAQP